MVGMVAFTTTSSATMLATVSMTVVMAFSMAPLDRRSGGHVQVCQHRERRAVVASAALEDGIELGQQGDAVVHRAGGRLMAVVGEAGHVEQRLLGVGRQ